MLAALLSASAAGLAWSDREYLPGFAWGVFAIVLSSLAWVAIRGLKIEEKRKIIKNGFLFYALSIAIPVIVIAAFPNADYSGRHMGNILAMYIWLGLLILSVTVLVFSIPFMIKKNDANQTSLTTPGAPPPLS